ncbi:MAG: gliding motility protein GldN [Flavobacteriales bacterium]|nr:gliding motility protein GldN [Flavobacteriales bacterium]
MKRFLLLILSVSFSTLLMGQDILDGAYKKDIRDGGRDRLIQPYHHVREADVMWSTKIWREIDLREKMNQVFYYPVKPIDDRKSLIDVLMDAIQLGEITAYGNAIFDDEWNFPMSDGDVEMIGIVGPKTDTTWMWDDEIEAEVMQINENEFDRTSVKKYHIKEEWYFDKQRSVMDVRIIGICPVQEQFDDDNNFLGFTPLFWVYYPQARSVLSKAEVFNRRKNDAARMTYDDIFHKRFFNSFITKESNNKDRHISTYKAGLDALLEAERIKDEIFNLEHDLWEY